MAYISFQPSDYFNTLLYSGNSSTQALTGLGFEPDLVWIKNRDGGAGSHDHYWFDQVRGTTKHIRSNTTNAEGTASGVTSFDSDGFTLGSSDGMNETSRTFACWNWRASGTSGSANTDGSISSTVSANTTSGFSIVKWTGSGADGTIGHGLGVAPKMVIVKSLANTTYWMVYHASLGNDKEIFLNATNASSASTTWNTTTPTSTVISLDGGAGNGVNYSGDYIAYCFAEKKGFSKFGSYSGNGSNDGVFVYTGYAPAFIMIKRTDSTAGWYMFDNKRGGYNQAASRLLANGTDTDAGTGYLDINSNGFKLRHNSTDYNGSGNSYIYMAFAEHPLVSSNDIPATAR